MIPPFERFSRGERNVADFYKQPFESITKMQHFGLPTRLLDISLNPLVSLYFACQPNVYKDKETDGKFIFIAGFPVYPSSDRVKILSLFATIKPDPYMCDESLNSFYPISKALDDLGVVVPYVYVNEGIEGYYFYYKT